MSNNLALDAMQFARKIHAEQRRKYTNNPYTDHLAEVAGIVATVSGLHPSAQVTLAVAWLHDTVEDQGVSDQTLLNRFGYEVMRGVMLLSDLETGNRVQRKEASRNRLSGAPGWVQDIKVADLISNISSIVMHDPKFAVVYLEEKRLLLDVLTAANPALLSIARTKLLMNSQKVYGKIIAEIKYPRTVDYSFVNRESLIASFLNETIRRFHADDREELFMLLKNRLTHSDISDDDRAMLDRAYDRARREFVDEE